MPLVTATTVNKAKASAAYLEWEETLPRIATQLSSLEAVTTRANGLYTIVEENSDQTMSDEFAAAALEQSQPIVNSHLDTFKAVLSVVARAGGLEHNDLCDALKIV